MNLEEKVSSIGINHRASKYVGSKKKEIKNIKHLLNKPKTYAEIRK